MKDPSCLAAGCPFKESTGGNAGACTGTPGVLSATEISGILKREDAISSIDPVDAVNIVTWDSDQWVSYDNAETLKMKVDYANERCLGG